MRVQGEQVYGHAQKELTAVGGEATRGFTDLRESIISRTRSLSLTGAQPSGSDSARSATGADDKPADANADEATVLARFKSEAAKRLHDLQKAEDAADEALLRFGSNIRDFLKSAVTIKPPSEGSAVIFESKDAQGKRVIHTSRFDAQLHVIHTSVDSFSKDPDADEYAAWAEKFSVEEKTGDIATDLAKYPELRATMEKLVPDTISYADFWKRYYFLRHSIETAEARRRDLLKGESPHSVPARTDSGETSTFKEKLTVYTQLRRRTTRSAGATTPTTRMTRRGRASAPAQRAPPRRCMPPRPRERR